MIQITVQQELFDQPTIQFQLFDHIVKAPIKNGNESRIKEQLFIEQTFLVFKTMFNSRANAYKNGHYVSPLSDAKLQAIHVLRGTIANIERDYHIGFEKYFFTIQKSFQYFDLLVPAETSRYYANFLPKYLTLKEIFNNCKNTKKILS